MKAKIFKHIFMVAMAVFVACFALTMCSLYSYFSAERDSGMKEEATYVAAAVEENGIEFLNHRKTSSTTRITWIDSDGTVLYDSIADPGTMENHKDREEVKAAMSQGIGESSRYSNTLSEKTTNYAIRLDDGTIIRVSGTQYTAVTLIIGMFYAMVAVLLLAILLSVLLASRVSKSVTEPINEIDLEAPDDRDVYPELQPLVRRINGQNRQIQRQMEELKLEHAKQDAIRREFTANVSHELKTPLTSISGYAEIIREGVAKPEDIKRFSGKIFDEAQRLITLVGDIMRLTQLEERALQPQKTKIDLYETCEGVLSHLEHAARKRNIRFALQGTHGVLMGLEQIIDEIVYNLCDNAIKYNKEDGTVTVSVSEDPGWVTLKVADSGIGIPSGELDRIFERFYRVDKSHSKEVGGTGLGLSIVKHGAAYHNAKINVESEVGKGTIISICFPKG
mgnify:CR=1 FL=1